MLGRGGDRRPARDTWASLSTTQHCSSKDEGRWRLSVCAHDAVRRMLRDLGGAFALPKAACAAAAEASAPSLPEGAPSATAAVWPPAGLMTGDASSATLSSASSPVPRHDGRDAGDRSRTLGKEKNELSPARGVTASSPSASASSGPTSQPGGGVSISGVHPAAILTRCSAGGVSESRLL